MSKNTEVTYSDEMIDELLAGITQGEWAVWDSCSWRRIGTRAPFMDGNVVCPIIQNDGHPDLSARREDLDFIAAAPALVRQLRRERDEERRLRKELKYIANAGLDDMSGFADVKIQECNSLREQLAAALRERERMQPLVDEAVRWRRYGYEHKLSEMDAPATSVSAEAVCWHCKVVLSSAPKPRCEDCPDECDVEGCEADGCQPTKSLTDSKESK